MKEDLGVLQAQSQAWAALRENLPDIERILEDGPKLEDRKLMVSCLEIVLAELYHRKLNVLLAEIGD